MKCIAFRTRLAVLLSFPTDIQMALTFLKPKKSSPCTASSIVAISGYYLCLISWSLSHEFIVYIWQKNVTLASVIISSQLSFTRISTTNFISTDYLWIVALFSVLLRGAFDLLSVRYLHSLTGSVYGVTAAYVHTRVRSRMTRGGWMTLWHL